MTPEELRQLVEKAMPVWGMSATLYAPSEAGRELIALTPDLARLCAELGEALAYTAKLTPGPAYSSQMDTAIKWSRVALAKLAELEAPK